MRPPQIPRRRRSRTRRTRPGRRHLSRPLEELQEGPEDEADGIVAASGNFGRPPSSPGGRRSRRRRCSRKKRRSRIDSPGSPGRRRRRRRCRPRTRSRSRSRLVDPAKRFTTNPTKEFTASRRLEEGGPRSFGGDEQLVQFVSNKSASDRGGDRDHGAESPPRTPRSRSRRTTSRRGRGHRRRRPGRRR